MNFYMEKELVVLKQIQAWLKKQVNETKIQESVYTKYLKEIEDDIQAIELELTK